MMPRSGVSGEELALPLKMQWAFAPATRPAAGWGEAEQDLIWKIKVPFAQPVRYDDAYQVAVVGGDVYFCASGENRIYCIDGHRGSVKWAAHTARRHGAGRRWRTGRCMSARMMGGCIA